MRKEIPYLRPVNIKIKAKMGIAFIDNQYIISCFIFKLKSRENGDILIRCLTMGTVDLRHLIMSKSALEVVGVTCLRVLVRLVDEQD